MKPFRKTKQEKTMSKIEEIKDTIRLMTVKQLGISLSLYSPTKTFTELGADSLDFVELVMCTEEKFGIEILNEVAEKLTTPEKLAEHLFSLND
jgi:acyl carrier protein